MLLVTSQPAFWGFGMLRGVFVGPVQASGRSYHARVAPHALRSEMFGLSALSGKATAFAGPLPRRLDHGLASMLTRPGGHQQFLQTRPGGRAGAHALTALSAMVRGLLTPPRMTSDTLHELTTLLRQQRAARLQGVTGTVADLRALAEERESELEEAAQEDRMAGMLTRLDYRGRRAIEDIDAALDRIADDTFGICIDCEEEIPIERLRIIPTASRCVECASVADRTRRPEMDGPTAILGDPPTDALGE